jgi:uncharacterized membrane protein
MNGYLTLGISLLAGAALIEAALIPGIVIGAAAVIAPRYLRRLGRGSRRANAAVRRRIDSAGRLGAIPVRAPRSLRIKQAIAKTITFRVIVTTVDFTANYLVIGELATAAGLSAFALVAGPIFYFVHETGWNYFSPSRAGIDLSVLFLGRATDAPPAVRRVSTINRAIAKTITFRTVATIMDFTMNYVVVGDLATAAGLSALGFVVGPFVYLGHEMAWDYYGSHGARPPELAGDEEHRVGPERNEPVCSSILPAKRVGRVQSPTSPRDAIHSTETRDPRPARSSDRPPR